MPILVLIAVIDKAAWLLTLLIVVRALLSWFPSVDYDHPLIEWIVRITDPILLPVRRVLPPLGGLDLSPLVAILLVRFAGYLLMQILVVLWSGG
jgi:YggT family protein